MTHLKTGIKAPEFEGLNQDGKTIRSKDFNGKKLIIYFYPKDDTPGCTAESCNLRDNYNFWISKGYSVIGISPDNVKSHTKFRKKYNLPFDLIADADIKIIKAYGVWGEKKLFGKLFDGVLRTTFVIDEKGIIEKIFTKVDTDQHTSQIAQELNIN